MLKYNAIWADFCRGGREPSSAGRPGERALVALDFFVLGKIFLQAKLIKSNTIIMKKIKK